MMHHKQVTHLDLYNAYLIARADEMRLEAETEQVAKRVGFKHPEHNAAECRDEEASDRRYDLIDKIIDTPAMTPSDLYVQAQVLADLMVRHGTYDSGNSDARIVRALVAGLARLAIVKPVTCGDGDLILKTLAKQHKNVYDEWKVREELLPEDEGLPDEIADALTCQASELVDTMVLVPASSLAGVGLKARIFEHPAFADSMHPALEQSIRDDIERLAAGAGGAVDEREIHADLSRIVGRTS